MSVNTPNSLQQFLFQRNKSYLLTTSGVKLFKKELQIGKDDSAYHPID